MNLFRYHKKKAYSAPLLCYLQPYGLEGFSHISGRGSYLSFPLKRHDNPTKESIQEWLDTLPCRRGYTHPNAWIAGRAPYITYYDGTVCPACGMDRALFPGVECDRCGWVWNDRDDVHLREHRKNVAACIDKRRWQQEALEREDIDTEDEDTKTYLPDGTWLYATARFRVTNGKVSYFDYDPFTLSTRDGGPAVSKDLIGIFIRD